MNCVLVVYGIATIIYLFIETMKRKLPDEEVDAIIRLRYGRLPNSRFDTAFVSYSKLARLWKVSASYIRNQVLQRLNELTRSSLETVDVQNSNRNRYGLRFVSQEM